MKMHVNSKLNKT